eukprot:scaffold50939_cov33-Tisochrysis_lutea.AAC.2
MPARGLAGAHSTFPVSTEDQELEHSLVACPWQEIWRIRWRAAPVRTQPQRILVHQQPGPPVDAGGTRQMDDHSAACGSCQHSVGLRDGRSCPEVLRHPSAHSSPIGPWPPSALLLTGNSSRPSRPPSVATK